MTLPRERLIRAGFAVTLTALIAVGVTALRSSTATNENARWVAHTIEVRQRLNEAAWMVSDAESGALGFGLTADTAYAALFGSARAQSLAVVGQIRALTVDNPTQQVRTDSLATGVARQLALLQKMIDVRDARVAASATTGLAADEVRAMDSLRGLIAAMKAEEARLLEIRTAALDATARRARIAVWAGLLLALAAVLTSGMLIVAERTQRRRAEVNLASHYARLTELGDLLDHAHVMLRGVDGTIRLWTAGSESVYGWSKAAAIGRVSHELLKTEFPTPLDEINRELEATGHWAGTLRHRRRDGSVVVKLSQWILHRDPGGATSVLEINADVTEQRRMEALFRVAVEGSPSGLLMVDADGKILLANHEIERLFGYSRDDLIGKRVDILLPDGMRDGHPAQREQFVADPRARAMGAGRELFGRRSDGQQVPVEIGLNPIKTDGGLLVLASVVDITERKRADFELKRSNEELERFAYVASHDLQEPLRMVASYVQLLGKRYKGKLDADADEFIGYASDGAVRMQRLIEDLLAFSRIGTRGTAMQRTDTEAVLSGALANLKLAITESGATVTSGALPTVDGDAGQLGHLFQNLVSNAVKFAGEKPPRIEISAVRDDHEWLFRVQDNGIGIDEQYFERIFVIFQRLHGREKYSGNGIGLSIARKIVERHGGRMWVESEPGRGTTFLFTLPVAKETA
jgi:PAS domain S-box-containing protein